jgi:Domain of unknown function (DUF4397)
VMPEGVACVQFINNAPNATLDVYKNGNRFVDDAPFRSAMPFKIVPAGLPMTIAVAAGNSTSANQALYQTTYTFENGKTYYATAIGVEGNAGTPLTLHINPNGRLEPLDAEKTAFSLFHGAAGAPAVDVDVVLVQKNLAANLAYGNAGDLATFAPGKFDFAIRPAGAPDPLAVYRADFSALQNKTAYIFASGVPGGAPAFGLFAALTDGTVLPLPATQFAKIQIVHNAPEPVVDVYADSTRIIDDMAFRTARPYISVPADRPVRLSFGGAGTTGVKDAFLPFGFTFAPDQQYTVFANGIVFGNPAFNAVGDPARELSAAAGKVDLSFFHGVPNVPAIDIGVFLGDNAVGNLGYEKFSPYAPLDPDTFYFQIKPAGGSTVAGTFRADLRPYAGKAMRVFASGFFAAAPTLGLFGVLPDGTVVNFPATPPPATMARIQVIHNSASAALDVYAGADKIKDDLAYRSATTFFEVPGGATTIIAAAPGNSASAANALDTVQFKFAAGKSYIIMAHGISGDAGKPFGLTMREAKAQADFPFGLDATLFHGATNAPSIDLESVFVGSLYSGLEYGRFSPYLGANPGINDWAVKQKDSSKVLVTYRADFTKQIGQAVTVFASGVLGGAPAFGLYAAYADGNVAALPPMPVSRVQIIHNATDPAIDLYAGTKFIINDLQYRSATRFVEFPTGRPIQFGVAGNASASSADVIFKSTATFSADKSYIAVLSGIPFDTVTPVRVFLHENALEKSAVAGQVSVATHHGSPKSPAVDVDAYFAGSNFVTNLGYGKSTDYATIPPALYDLQVRAAGTQNSLGMFRADLNALKDSALFVFASGLLSGEPKFGLFAATAGGRVVELPASPTARVQIIHNAPSIAAVDVYAGPQRLLDNFEFRKATPFVTLPADRPVNIGLAPQNSQGPNDAVANQSVTFVASKTYVAVAGPATGAQPFKLFINENAREKSQDNNVELNFFHGAPGAPEVDVIRLQNTPVFFDDLEYGEFSNNFVSVPPAQYRLGVTPSNDNNTLLKSYRANLSAYGGQAITLFASGILNGQPAFGLWATLPNGMTFPLEEFVKTNELEEKITRLSLSPNPANGVFALKFDLEAQTDLRYILRDLSGRAVQQGDFGRVDAGAFVKTLATDILPTGLYLLELRSESGVWVEKLEVQR